MNRQGGAAAGDIRRKETNRALTTPVEVSESLERKKTGRDQRRIKYKPDWSPKK